MANRKGKSASPAKDARSARPLMLREFFSLFGGSPLLMEKALNGAVGKKDVAKSVLGTIVGLEKGVRVEDVQRVLAKVDENEATRILRDMTKKMAASQAQPAA